MRTSARAHVNTRTAAVPPPPPGVALGEACTIVLRGASTHILEEAERSLHDALCVLKVRESEVAMVIMVVTSVVVNVDRSLHDELCVRTARNRGERLAVYEVPCDGEGSHLMFARFHGVPSLRRYRVRPTRVTSWNPWTAVSRAAEANCSPAAARSYLLQETVADARVVYGGGWPEIKMAKAVEELAAKTPGGRTGPSLAAPLAKDLHLHTTFFRTRSFPATSLMGGGSQGLGAACSCTLFRRPGLAACPAAAMATRHTPRRSALAASKLPQPHLKGCKPRSPKELPAFRQLERHN